MDTPGVARAYALILRSRLAAQLQYRGSFVLELCGQALVVLVELVETVAIFHQVPALAGFSFNDSLVIFGLASTGFACADLAVGQIDAVGQHIRAGTLEVLMIRPLSVLGQLVSSDLQLRRLGRIALAVVVLAVALHRSRIDWTPARVALLGVTPVCGLVIFSALWIASSSVIFWIVEGQEFTSAVTYGGNYLAQFPLSVFNVVLGRFFTFVLPNAFVAYLPACVILGRTDPTGLPSWLAWCTPVAAVWTAGLAGLAWRAGLRRYVGAGG